ncbi:MAG: hypothetical protein NXH78_16225 [Hyphomonadaceae bacterium]|nr:hypothetical protein [Hyphomonadaceae bacterium]
MPMKLRTSASLFAAAIIIAACALIANPIDAPAEVGEDYLARESEFMESTDSCGPEFVQEKLPGTLKSMIEPLADGPFRPVCARHDACYRLGEKSQAWCDDRMRDEMFAICDTGQAGVVYRVPGVGPSLCRFHGGMYYRLINSTFGGVAYGGAPGGEIAAIHMRDISDVIGGDEIEICADILNPTPLMQEYDLELHTGEGQLIDREPDLHEENIRAGETETLCVSTNWNARWDGNNIGDEVFLSLRADTPESFAFWNDMVIVDSKLVDLTTP